MKKTGEYAIYQVPSSAGAKRLYRFGNHPIRLAELVRDYGAATVIEIVKDRELAKTEARRLNKS